MRAKIVNKTMEIIALTDRSNDSFRFEQNAKFGTYLDNAKANLNSKRKSQNSSQNEPSINLNYLRRLDSYEHINPELSEKIINQDSDNFVYEDYIMKLIYPNHMSFREAYNRLEEVNLAGLPDLVKEIVDEFVRIANKRKIFIDEDKMYDLLFSRHKMGLVIELFKNNVLDLDISDEKIIKIYDKIKTDRSYNYDVASKEINKLVDFVELLSA